MASKMIITLSTSFFTLYSIASLVVMAQHSIFGAALGAAA